MASVVEKIALSHPDISIRFIQNNQNKLYTSGNNNLKDLIYTVFGREITANLLEVSASCPGVTITGYIGKPVIARSNRNYENYFVNGRYVRSNILSKAIEEAYKAIYDAAQISFYHAAFPDRSPDTGCKCTSYENGTSFQRWGVYLQPGYECSGECLSS